jgi:hypothetical protein
LITGILGQVTGQFERRFLLNAFFPTVVFSLLAGVVVTAATGGVANAVRSWEGETPAVQTLIVIAWTAAVLVAANLVANGTFWIIQLFEGYVGPLRWAAGWAREYQLGHALRADHDLRQRRYPVYPDKLRREDIAPTTLGNVLLSAETYPLHRYGVPATRVWPRLYVLLPGELRESLAAARASMEFLLVVAFYASAFVPTATVYLLWVEAPIEWTFVALVGGSLVALVAYRGAHAPAEIYGDHIRAAFDLHRFELLATLRAPRPATYAEERRIWQIVVRHLDWGDDPQWRYVDAS